MKKALQFLAFYMRFPDFTGIEESSWLMKWKTGLATPHNQIIPVHYQKMNQLDSQTVVEQVLIRLWFAFFAIFY